MLDTPSASHTVWSRHGLLYQRRHVHRDRSVALHNILLQCQKFWAVAEIYPLEGDNIFDRGLFIVHSILTPNRKWSVFVPLYTRRFNKDRAFSHEQGIFHICAIKV